MIQKNLKHLIICCLFIIPLPCISAEITPDISGTWLLNKQLSDDYQEKIREYVSSVRSGHHNPDGVTGASSKGNSRGSGSRPTGAGRGRPSGAAQQGSIGGKNPRATMQNTLKNNSVLFSEKLKITQNEPEIILASSSTHQRIIYTDGRGISISASRLAEDLIQPYIAAWEKGEQLVIETNTHKGLKIEEYFTLSQDGKQLHTISNLRMPNSDQSISIIRVYDLSE